MDQMWKDFATEGEAVQHAAFLNAGDPTQFCPLTQKTCRKDCVCFALATVHDLRGGTLPWRVRGFNCDNSMFYEHELR